MQVDPAEKFKAIMFYTYVMIDSKSKLYIGSTKDLKKRLEEHNRGKTISLRSRGPYKLIYYEACINEADARRREGYLKTSQGYRLLKRRLKEYLYSLNSSAG